MKKLILYVILIVLIGCKNHEQIEIDYIKGGQVYNQTINVSHLLTDSGEIKTDFIQRMSFVKVVDVYLEDDNPDKVRFISDSVKLDFTQPIRNYSPEYYTLTTAYFIDKAIAYYNQVFNGAIDFNTQADYRSITVLLEDYALFTYPNQYILKENQQFSPSIFYHEVGHLAFWTLEEDLGVKFKGLSPMHVGLLEYFTVSLFDCPVVGETVLPELLIRNATIKHTYPQQDSMKLRRTFELLKTSYKEDIADTTSFMNKYYTLSLNQYESILDKVVDNHRGGMLYTSTLWRIREQIGQKETDQLVAETILALNKVMEQRSVFYTPDSDEELKDKLMWYDLYYGLLLKDKELHGGKNQSIISTAFQESNFPIQKITVANDEA